MLPPHTLDQSVCPLPRTLRGAASRTRVCPCWYTLVHAEGPGCVPAGRGWFPDSLEPFLSCPVEKACERAGLCPLHLPCAPFPVSSGAAQSILRRFTLHPSLGFCGLGWNLGVLSCRHESWRMSQLVCFPSAIGDGFLPLSSCTAFLLYENQLRHLTLPQEG